MEAKDAFCKSINEDRRAWAKEANNKDSNEKRDRTKSAEKENLLL